MRSKGQFECKLKRMNGMNDRGKRGWMILSNLPYAFKVKSPQECIGGIGQCEQRNACVSECL